MKYTRQFISFSGKCPFKCNHCYTFCSGYDKNDLGNSVEDIIASLKEKQNRFDIVYISGHKENFINPDEGLRLCEELFSNFSCDIMITTRCVFNDEQLGRLSLLNNNMRSKGRDLFFCASIPALDSYKKLEPNAIIPSPDERITNFIRVSKMGIYTILTLRPLCPNEYIPVQELLRIIERCEDFSTAVLSSGIVVNYQILSKLQDFPTDFKSVEKPLMPCLKNDISMQYVDVSSELDKIEKKCIECEVPFFTHSMPAIEYIKGYSLDYEHDS